jgi:chaperone modulatory protein CbpM
MSEDTTLLLLRAARLDPAAVEAWVEEGWLPRGGLTEPDLARACLIRDLRERMGVNDEGVAVVLDLLDQVHGLRQALHRVSETMHHLPEPLRQETLTVARAVLVEQQEPPPEP